MIILETVPPYKLLKFSARLIYLEQGVSFQNRCQGYFFRLVGCNSLALCLKTFFYSSMIAGFVSLREGGQKIYQKNLDIELSGKIGSTYTD